MTDHTTENTCVVCFKNVEFYSIGECDHPVCFECSTRMRVLCLQNECPICRQDLARVVFTETVLPYKELRNRVFTDRQFERQFKIGFSTDEIKQAYEHLLENRCNICDKLPPFRNFTTLSDHMRKVHERHYCDLCVKHLRIFTSERRCYTRQELAHHRRKGDLDDTSHRGHPLCEFCEERFMDADELYRHLRKEHLYCHLCDADGRNLYYASHSALAHHFRTDHYLCEEGECAGQHLTAVFRSEIDLKAHKATVHSRGLNKGAARQARTLELQFNITPHPVAQRTPRERDHRDQRDHRERQERPPSPPPTPPPPPRIDTRSEELFPRLSAAPQAPSLLVGGSSKVYKGGDQLTRNDRNFPTLGGAPAPGPSRPAQRPAPAPAVAATVLRNSKPVSVLHSQPASASNFRLTQTSAHRSVPPRRPLSDDDYSPLDDEYPSLAHTKDDHPSLGARTTQPSKVAMINKEEMQAMKSNPTPTQRKKPQTASSEAFPALSSTATPSNPPQWITVSKAKEKQKVIKLDPTPPTPREQTFNPVADFPGLPVNKTKPKKQPTPQPVKNPFVQPIKTTPNPFAVTETKTKKEKKKNSSKKENFSDLSEPTAPLVQVNGLDKKYARDLSLTEANLNNNNEVVDRKIKTIETVPAAAAPEKNRNTGNGDFSLAAKEFPSLNPKAKNQPIKNVKVEYPRENKKIPNGNVSAPPGFKPRPTCDGMMFTNSAGQTFSAPVHAYIPPPEFEARNRSLVKKFSQALGSAAAVENFKVASRAFRDSIISAEEFYMHCKNAMGSELDSVYSDLVALLPDIAKQQELVVGRDLDLEICATCGQVVAPNDRIAHDSAHWPPLAPR